MEIQRKLVFSVFFLSFGAVHIIYGSQNFGFGGPFLSSYSYPIHQTSLHGSNSFPPSTGNCGSLWSYQMDDYGGGQSGLIKILNPHWKSSHIQISLTVAAQLHPVSGSILEQLADNLCELLNFWTFSRAGFSEQTSSFWGAKISQKCSLSASEIFSVYVSSSSLISPISKTPDPCYWRKTFTAPTMTSSRADRCFIGSTFQSKTLCHRFMKFTTTTSYCAALRKVFPT